MPEIFLGSDHRGFEIKKHLVEKLNLEAPEGYQVIDLGPFELDPADDYNDAATGVARAVRQAPENRGILVCGSANGIAIQANRFKGVRAAIALSEEQARLAREHNDANILCLGADFLDEHKIDDIANIFLNTKFSEEERHIRRVRKLDAPTDTEEELA